MTEPRILVAGGPVERRVNQLLALVIGLLIGGLAGSGILSVIALKAAHDAHTAINLVRASRRNAVELSCKEANERHMHVFEGLSVIAARSKPAASPQTLELFVQAIAPSYDCAKRTRELTKP